MNMVSERVAVAKCFFCGNSHLWVTPTAVKECQPIKDPSRRNQHFSGIMSILQDYQPEGASSNRVTDVYQHHKQG